MKEDLGVFFLRLGAGGMMLIAHGWGKLINFSKIAPHFPDPLGIGKSLSLGLATGAEFLCALLIMVGLKTRLASIPLIITMLVAAFGHHALDPFKAKEKALVYAICFLATALLGSGRFSVDQFLEKND